MRATVNPSAGGDYPTLEIGGYPAYVVGITDIGLHDTKFGLKHQIVFTFELPLNKGSDDRPYHLVNKYTLSLNEKANLRKDLEQMKGKIPPEKLQDQDFVDTIFQKALTTPVQISVGQYTNKEGYVNNCVDQVGRAVKGMEYPPLESESWILDLDNFDQGVFDKLPEWLQKKVTEGRKLLEEPPVSSTTATAAETSSSVDDEDDIPW